MTSDNERIGGITRDEWKRTDVAKASTIFCQHCGERFETPHDFYDHLDTEHADERDRASKRRTAKPR